MNEKEYSSNWGGKREGSGRKKTGKNSQTVSISGTKEEIAQIKTLAEEHRTTVSKYVISKVLDNKEK